MNNFYSFNQKEQQLVNSNLMPMENILWGDKPNPLKVFLKYIPMAIPGILVTAFAIFWTIMASNSNFYYGLFGIPFIIAGLIILTSPFWSVRKAKRTLYIVTSKRAMIIEEGISTIVKSFNHDKLHPIAKNIKEDDGSGDLILEEQRYTSPLGRQKKDDIGFISITNVFKVERLLMTQKQTLK